MHQTRQAVRTQLTLHRGDDEEAGGSYAQTAAPKSVVVTSSDNVVDDDRSNPAAGDYQNGHEATGVREDDDEEDDDEYTMSDDEKRRADDEKRRANDPIFGKLCAYVKFSSERRRRDAESGEAIAAVEPPPQQSVSRRQRTSATVAAERTAVNGEADETDGLEQQQQQQQQQVVVPRRKKPGRRPKSETGADPPKKRRKTDEVAASPPTTTVDPAKKRRKSEVVEAAAPPPTTKAPPPPSDSFLVGTDRGIRPRERRASRSKKKPRTTASSTTTKHNGAFRGPLKRPSMTAAAGDRHAKRPQVEVRFVEVVDANLPPDEIVECDRSDPPTLRYVAAALVDARGQRLKKRGGVEVVLEIDVDGEPTDPLVCPKPFPGGLFYFSNLTYTSTTSGLWTMRLSGRWTKDKSQDRITATTHTCEVRYAGDPPLRRDPPPVAAAPSTEPPMTTRSPSPPAKVFSDDDDDDDDDEEEEEEEQQQQPGNRRRRRFVWSEAQVEACRDAFLASRGDLPQADLEALALEHGLAPDNILQRFAYFRKHGVQATPPKEFLHEEAGIRPRNHRRKQARPLRGAKASEVKALLQAPDGTPVPRRQWFLHDDALVVGRTSVIFDAAKLHRRVQTLVDAIPDPPLDDDDDDDLVPAPAPFQVETESL